MFDQTAAAEQIIRTESLTKVYPRSDFKAVDGLDPSAWRRVSR